MYWTLGAGEIPHFLNLARICSTLSYIMLYLVVLVVIEFIVFQLGSGSVSLTRDERSASLRRERSRSLVLRRPMLHSLTQLDSAGLNPLKLNLTQEFQEFYHSIRFYHYPMVKSPVAGCQSPPSWRELDRKWSGCCDLAKETTCIDVYCFNFHRPRLCIHWLEKAECSKHIWKLVWHDSFW